MQEEFKWIKPSNQQVVRINFFGTRILYLNKKTKVVFKYSSEDVDYIYVLKRKGKIFWKAITYIKKSSYYVKDLNSVIERLLKDEREYNEEIERQHQIEIEKSKCVF